ncbi:PE family protein, partial [Mycobacterium riyadhense]
MSYVVIAPDVLAMAAREVAGIGVSVGAANAAAASSTTVLVAAAGDEVSAAIAALFGAYGVEYQALSVQVAGFHERFVQTLAVGGAAYGSAEAANAAQVVLGVVNAPSQGLFGRPLIGDGANASTPGGAGG